MSGSQVTSNQNERPWSAIAFLAAWVLVFALYLPAAKAGFVADFTGWLDQMLRYGFWDNINRTHYHGKSLYQATQCVTWLYFQLAGTNAWAWHMLFVTTHAANAALLFTVIRSLLLSSGVRNPELPALGGVLLFTLSPALAEVIVWEPSWHFLQGLLFILLTLRCTQRYLTTGSKQAAACGVIIFALATFSLEIFYITPWLALSLIIWYTRQGIAVTTARKALGTLFMPMLVLFFMHLLLFRCVYGEWVAHIGNDPFQNPETFRFNKPLKHLLNLLLLCRYWPEHFRNEAYRIADRSLVTLLFHVLSMVIMVVTFIRLKKGNRYLLASGLLYSWGYGSLLLLQPLWFQPDMVVVFDRYTYFAVAFMFMAVALFAAAGRHYKVKYVIIIVFALVSLRFTVLVSRFWMKSEKVISSIMNTLPVNDSRIILLLNLPQNFQGVPMIGAEPESELAMMYNGLHHHKIDPKRIHDVLAYNMVLPEDGATATFTNDSTIEVTLNQWGTWWWYAMRGAQSYENADYRLDLVDPGHRYLLILKHPRSQYLPLITHHGALHPVTQPNQ